MSEISLYYEESRSRGQKALSFGFSGYLGGLNECLTVLIVLFLYLLQCKKISI